MHHLLQGPDVAFITLKLSSKVCHCLFQKTKQHLRIFNERSTSMEIIILYVVQKKKAIAVVW